MMLISHGVEVAIVEHLPVGGSPSALGRLTEVLQREVLPHFYAPSTRQAALDQAFSHTARIEEPTLDSPSFTPAALAEFAARGFVRKNRWATGR